MFWKLLDSGEKERQNPLPWNNYFNMHLLILKRNFTVVSHANLKRRGGECCIKYFKPFKHTFGFNK